MEESVNNCAVKIAVRERRAATVDTDSSIINYPAPDTLIVDERPFTFDHVLGPMVGQQELYEVLIRPLVAKVKLGYNCTAMAYGQTGTGKSFTMGLNLNNFEGADVGVIPRCLQEILKDDTNEATSENCVRRNFCASFIEIYNEKIYDLLADNSTEPVTARDYKQVGATRAPLTSLADCYSILSRGNKNRHVRPTKMNSQSSRSHAIFTIYVLSSEQSGAEAATATTNAACLNLVDLAGSEGVRRTGHQGVAMSEGVHINQGLLCIGKVLQAMVLGNKVIPYRDSVLSSVLQDSLSSDSFLTLLACISPSRADLSETLSTLRFAQNAKHLRHAPQIKKIVADIKKNRVKTPHQTRPLQIRNGPTPNNRLFSNIPKSSVKRLTTAPHAYHSNTFSTPNKIKPTRAQIFNNTEMGMTPKAKQKAQLLGMARSTLLKQPAPSAFPPFEFTNGNRETIFDQTIGSGSSIMSFNISTSTSVDAPAVANKAHCSYSPVVRQCVAEMQKMFPATIRQELKSIMKELLTNTNAPSSHELNNLSVSQISEPVATSSPDFKIPEVPKFTARKGHLNFDSSLESNPNLSNNGVTIVEEKEQNVNRETQQQSFSCVAEETSINKPLLSLTRRSSQRIAERSMSHNVVLDESSASFTTSKHRRSVRQQAKLLKTIAEVEVQPQQLPKTRKKKSASTMNNSVIASYIQDANNTETKLSKSVSIAKHRQAILNLLNTGSMKALQLLPQVGPKTAYQIVTQRVLNGKFKNVAQVERLPIWRGKSWERFATANILQ